MKILITGSLGLIGSTISNFYLDKNIDVLGVDNDQRKIFFGEKASNKAERSAKDTFAGGGIGSDLPEIKIKFKEIEKGISLVDLVANKKILTSKSEVRRAITNDGLRIDGVIIKDEKTILFPKNFKNNKLKLSYGKKKHYLVRII